MPAPNAPTHPLARAGDKAIIVSWTKPSSGAAPTSYMVRCKLSPSGTFVSQQSCDATRSTRTFTGLTNGQEYTFDITAVNASGSSAPVTAGPAAPVAFGSAVNVTLTKVAPDKIANRRAGQSSADAPRITVTGTNLTVPWGIDDAHTLEWVLYTDTSFTTVVGSDTDVYVDTAAATSLKLSSPLAPGGADVDSNHLIGPWRLKARWVADPSSPTTISTAYSPAFYTTAVGTIVIGTLSPEPLHDGDLVTVTGPDVGVCNKAIVTIGGITVDASLTRVDQNTATFICPTFGFQLAASGNVVLEYSYNGNILGTDPFAATWEPVAGGTGGGSSYVPPTGSDIPTGDQEYPVIVKRWVFTDPATGETYTMPRNPSAMTTPFPQRNITAKMTTAINGQMLLTEGSPTPANWQFTGITVDAAHYEKLRHWVNDINHRVQITDHYGRVIDCVLLLFDAKPKRDMHRLWSHDYTVTALVIKVGEPTVVPA